MKNFLRNISKLFYKKLKYRGMYAVHSGDRAGSFFIYIEEENKGNGYAILLMPNPMEAIYVQSSEIEQDLKYKNIKFVRRIPFEVYEVCKVNFIYYAKKAGIRA